MREHEESKNTEHNSEGDLKLLNARWLLVTTLADIDIFLLKEENQTTDKNQTFTVEEIRNQLFKTAKKMTEVCREFHVDMDVDLVDVVKAYPDNFFTQREIKELNKSKKDKPDSLT